MEENHLLNETINHIFVQGESHLARLPQLSRSKGKVPQKELELALTIILVDLASIDSNFEPREYQTISLGLRRLFGNSRDIKALVNRAQLALANLRGTQEFAELLRDNLSEEQRLSVIDIIEEVIGADGLQDGFELYLKHKYAKLLGIPLEANASNKKAPEY